MRLALVLVIAAVAAGELTVEKPCCACPVPLEASTPPTPTPTPAARFWEVMDRSTAPPHDLSLLLIAALYVAGAVYQAARRSTPAPWWVQIATAVLCGGIALAITRYLSKAEDDMSVASAALGGALALWVLCSWTRYRPDPHAAMPSRAIVRRWRTTRS